MKLVRHRYGTGIVAVFLLTTVVQAQEASFEGQRIASVVFDPEKQPLERRELDEILPVKPGQIYAAADIRAAIERLYATGRFQDIQVDANNSEGGVSVKFITKNSWFIGKVSVTEDFAEPPNPGQIVNASRLQLGDPFDMAQIPAAVENIRKLLVQNGYFEPTIDPRFHYDNTYQQVNITFAIQTGKRAHYEAPRISGDTTVLSEDVIATAAHWRRFLLPGYRGITLSRTRSGIASIRLKYENANRLLATVVLNGIEPEQNN